MLAFVACGLTHRLGVYALSHHVRHVYLVSVGQTTIEFYGTAKKKQQHKVIVTLWP